MTSPTFLLRDYLTAIEKNLYTRQTPIVITSWNPDHLNNSFIVTYTIEKKSMQGIPLDEVCLTDIPEDSDFFLICEPRADKHLPERAEREGVSLALAVREAAVLCSWEKVQWNQEYQMQPHIEITDILFTPKDIANCANNLSPFSYDQIREYQVRGELHYWNTQRHIFLARWSKLNWALWRCKRYVAAITVSAVARGCPSDGEVFLFLQRLKSLADHKAGIQRKGEEN